jgi:hypothetical protein
LSFSASYGAGEEEGRLLCALSLGKRGEKLGRIRGAGRHGGRPGFPKGWRWPRFPDPFRPEEAPPGSAGPPLFPWEGPRKGVSRGSPRLSLGSQAFPNRPARDPARGGPRPPGNPSHGFLWRSPRRFGQKTWAHLDKREGAGTRSLWGKDFPFFSVIVENDFPGCDLAGNFGKENSYMACAENGQRGRGLEDLVKEGGFPAAEHPKSRRV